MHSIRDVLRNRYSIIDIIGNGGSGCVYLVWDLAIGKKWALKEIFLNKSYGDYLAHSEIEMLKSLDEPSIPRIVDAWQENNSYYIVSDYIEGISLDKYISGGPLPKKKVFEILSHIVKSLIYLHSHNPPILYLDLKPSNIMIRSDGKAFLIDFGIASNLKMQRFSFGTYGYAAPEQIDESINNLVSEKTDIYALGITYFVLRTGITPGNTSDILSQVKSCKKLSFLEKGFILKCANRDISKRFLSMEDTLQSLNRINFYHVKKNFKVFMISTLILSIPLLLLLGNNPKSSNREIKEMLDRTSSYFEDGYYSRDGLRIIEEYINAGELGPKEDYYTFLVARTYFEKYGDYREALYYFEMLNEEEYPCKDSYILMCNLETSFEYDDSEIKNNLLMLRNETVKMPEGREKYEALLFLSFCFEHYVDGEDGINTSKEILFYLKEHIGGKKSPDSYEEQNVLNEVDRRLDNYEHVY